jgi:hypothetical protein
VGADALQEEPPISCPFQSPPWAAAAARPARPNAETKVFIVDCSHVANVWLPKSVVMDFLSMGTCRWNGVLKIINTGAWEVEESEGIQENPSAAGHAGRCLIDSRHHNTSNASPRSIAVTSLPAGMDLAVVQKFTKFVIFLAEDLAERGSRIPP